MKKLLTMLVCALFSIGAASAQNTKTYTGLVVDKNGNPLVGAEVMVPGGGAATITDSDGSFKIEVPVLLKKLTASYAGMQEKTLKLGDSSNLVFNMRKLKKMTGFISVVANIGVAHEDYEYVGYDYYSDYSSNNASVGIGIMGGQLGQSGKWGWYVKGMGIVDYDGTGFGTLTAGAIRKIGTKFHLYFGAGGAYLYDSFGVSGDLGAIFTVSSHVNIIAGLNYTQNFDHSDQYNLMNLNIGVGYTF